MQYPPILYLTISVKPLNSSNYNSPYAIIDNHTPSTDQITIANSFNKYISTIALDIQSFIRYSKSSFLTSSHHLLFLLLIVMKFVARILP